MTPTPKPAPLVLRAGCRYVTRNGQTSAEVTRNKRGSWIATHPFRCGEITYRANGTCSVASDRKRGDDLIRLYRKPTPRPRRAKVARWCYIVHAFDGSISGVMDWDTKRDAIRERESDGTDGFSCGPVERHLFAPSPKPKAHK